MEFQGPFDRNAKRVLETSARRAGLLGKNTVGTEHLLLGLAARRSSAAGRILTQAGVSSWRGLYYTAKLTGTGMPRQKPQHISRNLQLVLRQAAGAAGNGTAGHGKNGSGYPVIGTADRYFCGTGAGRLAFHGTAGIHLYAGSVYHRSDRAGTKR